MKFLQFAFPVLASIFCILPFNSANAQEIDKPNVFMDYFTRGRGVNFGEAEQLRNRIMQEFIESNRVHILDVDTYTALAIEESRRQSENISSGSDPERLKVMTQEGANFLIMGNINSWAVERYRLDDGTPYYKSVLDFTLKIVDPNNGKLVNTHTYKVGGELLNFVTGNTPEEARMNVAEQGSKRIRNLIVEAFPISGVFLEPVKIKKDKIETFYAKVGAAHGAAKKDFFKLYIKSSVAGFETLKEIGEAEIEAVEADVVSLLKVKKGEKEIKKAFDDGKDIIVKSAPKKKSGFGKLTEGADI